MRCTVATLLSAGIFSLCAVARSPPPPQPDASSALLTKRFINGWCGVHVVQYQKNNGPSISDNGNTEYRLDVNLYDAGQDDIGSASKLSATGGTYYDVPSRQLPTAFQVQVGANDDQPVFFQYNGQAWTSNDGQCSVGNYDDGSRNMDCGFNC